MNSPGGGSTPPRGAAPRLPRRPVEPHNENCCPLLQESWRLQPGGLAQGGVLAAGPGCAASSRGGGSTGLRQLVAGLLLVRRVEVEIDAAERPLVVGLAEDDGDLFVQGDAVPQMGAAVFVGLDGLLHEGSQRLRAILRHLVEADDVLVVALDGLADFLFEHFDRQDGIKLLSECRKKGKNILISVPVAMSAQEAVYGNEFETHKYAWKKQDFKNIPDKFFLSNSKSIICFIGEDSLRIRKIIQKRKTRAVVVTLLDFLHVKNLVKHLIPQTR